MAWETDPMAARAQVLSHGSLRRSHGPARSTRIAAACMLVMSSSSALAEDDATECDTSLGQNGLTACAARLAEKADADMAMAFARAKRALEVIDKDVSEVRPNPAGAVEALEQSQRGWLAYRKGRCIIAGFAERGGSIEPMVVYECEEEMTRARIAELDAWAEE